MSTLTWDNLDEWVANTPKDANGHFIMPKKVDVGEMIKEFHSGENTGAGVALAKSIYDQAAAAHKEHKDNIAEILATRSTPSAEAMLPDAGAGIKEVWAASVEKLKKINSEGKELFPAFTQTAVEQNLTPKGESESFSSQVGEVDISAKLNNLPKIDADQAEQQFDPLAKARHALKDLDTSEAEEEFKEIQAGIQYRKDLEKSGLLRLNNSPMLNPNMSPEELKEYHAKLAAYHDSIRKEVVERMDKDMEHGGRVSVGEKFLLNCKADLNQLIPFKYTWAWDFYIKSNEHHWMPGEYTLDRCKVTYNELARKEKMIIARAYYIAEYRKILFPEVALVNFYRLCTNPEVREYQLRQAMEFLQNHHAWMELNEIFGFTTELVEGKSLAAWLKEKEQDTLSTWYVETGKFAKYAQDLSSVTNTNEGLRNFIKTYTILHMHTNFINQLVPYFQVIKLARSNPGLDGLGRMFGSLLRDIRMQYGFSKLFLAQLLEEENQVHDNELISELTKALKGLSNITLDFADTLRLDPNEFTDIANVITHYTDEVLSIINPMHETRKLNANGKDGLLFIETVENSVKAKEHGSGNSNGQLGWG